MKHRFTAASLLGVMIMGTPMIAAAGMLEREVGALEALAAKGSPRAQQELQQRLKQDGGRGRVLTAYCQAVKQRLTATSRLQRTSSRVTIALGKNGFSPVSQSGGRMPEKSPSMARCTPMIGRAMMVPSPPPAAIKALVHKLAPTYGLDPALVLAVIAVESNYQAGVVSNKNAMGLMQLIPETAERFGVTNVFNAEDNIRGGMKYLRWLLAYFDGDVTLALAGYNAGEGAVRQYKGIPPYQETQNYVLKVHSLYRPTHHPFDRATASSAGLGRELVAELSFASPRRDR